MKRDTLVLQFEVGREPKHKQIKICSFENILKESKIQQVL